MQDCARLGFGSRDFARARSPAFSFLCFLGVGFLCVYIDVFSEAIGYSKSFTDAGSRRKKGLVSGGDPHIIVTGLSPRQS